MVRCGFRHKSCLLRWSRSYEEKEEEEEEEGVEQQCTRKGSRSEEGTAHRRVPSEGIGGRLEKIENLKVQPGQGSIYTYFRSFFSEYDEGVGEVTGGLPRAAPTRVERL
ncbi:hypothetical protein E2C01_097913 [Portunus trituberculatus]|uniref:Uncharacterized protein n=1 Tax=Portunus trituberculatus TaxID=210409 RepID=A0A5B7K644_PORTR|nr:hypothetical protein [Portunus trituberculatus]